METLDRIDEEILLWLNGGVGHFPWLDAVVELLISDYMVPVLMSLVLLGLWFARRTEAAHALNQRAVLNAVGGLAIASLVVDWFINPLYFRSRPFVDHAVFLLFYEPTDSSFPANPATVAFAVATGVWLWNRRVGAALYGLAVLYALSRVYGGVFYPLDVVGGAAIGIAASLLVTVVIRRFAVIPTLAIRIARALYLG